MKQYFGSCVDNPFKDVEELIEIIDDADKITQEEFTNNCDVEPEIELYFYKYPNGYGFYRNGDIYFFINSGIEHFYK